MLAKQKKLTALNSAELAARQFDKLNGAPFRGKEQTAAAGVTAPLVALCGRMVCMTGEHERAWGTVFSREGRRRSLPKKEGEETECKWTQGRKGTGAFLPLKDPSSGSGLGQLGANDR